MLQFIECNDGVVAVAIFERVTSADLDAVMDRLEPALQRHAQVHVFVETRAIDGIELSGLGSHVARAMPMLGRLQQFGRVAVVADQPWVRTMTRLESVLLPFVSYRVFQPEQREQALAWVLHGA